MKKVQGNYVQLAKSIMTASHITNTETGEVLEVTLPMKVLYAYMRDCYFHFTESKYCKGFYNESDESMANNIGSSKATVGRALKVLVTCGLVESTGGTLSRRFVVKDAHETTWVYSNPKLVDWKADAPERVAKSEAVNAALKQKREDELEASKKLTVGFKMEAAPTQPPKQNNKMDDIPDPYSHYDETDDPDWIPF